ncbi:TPA: hypothetical protein U1C31_002244 [Streptococcus suis]|nr:hypothetical protein [Streptococcus suis]
MKEKEDLFIVTGGANTKREIAKKIQSLWKVDVYLDGYSSLNENDFIEKVGRENLGEFGYFLLKQSKEDKQQFPVVYDYLKARARPKLELFANINTKKENND